MFGPVYKTNDIVIFYANIRSLPCNFDNLESYLSTLTIKPQIIILTETWISNNSNNLFDIMGYDKVDIFRLKKKGGGIRIYYQHNMNIKQITDLTHLHNSIELLFIAIKINKNFNLTIGAIYRPPTNTYESFNNFILNLENILRNRNVVNKKTIICGDFNLSLCGDISNNSLTYSNLMTENGFDQFVTNKTHTLNTTGVPNSLIDHFWANFNLNNRCNVLNYPLTDHLPILFGFSGNIGDKFVQSKFRDLSIENKIIFRDNWQTELERLNLDTYSTLNSKTEFFCNWLSKLIDKYFPIKIKNKKLKNLQKPWIDDSSKKLIKKKHKLFNYLKEGLIPLEVFKSYCKLLSSLLSLKKENYIKQKLSNCDDAKKHWSIINSLIGKSKQKNKIHNIDINGRNISDKNEISNEFNDYFANIGIRTQESLQPAINNYYEHMQPHNRSIYLFPSTPNEVVKVLNNLKSSNSMKDLPIPIIKIIKIDIAKIISGIFNTMIHIGEYPDCLKKARVVPVYKKKGSQDQLNNYRPISILPILNKVIEKLLHVRISSFLMKHSLLSPNQYGFTKSKNTEQAVMKFFEIGIKSLGNKTICGTLYLDFSKAFDTVDHGILLNKLTKYGIRGKVNDLIASYLSNRSQVVDLDDIISNHKAIRVGVPQGSVLGPLLFNIYTNDLNTVLDDSHKILFADDTIILKSSEDPIHLVSELQNALDLILDWCNFNKLSLNSDKTKVMYFTNRMVLLEPLTLNNNIIEKVTHYKYLGVNVDHKLNFSQHIESLCSKLSTLVYMSNKIKPFMDSNAKHNYYYAMVQSILSYALPAWGGNLIETEGGNRLKYLQNKIIFNLFGNNTENIENDLNAICKRSKVLRITELYKYKICIIMSRVIHHGYLPHLKEQILGQLRNHTHNTRAKTTYLLPFPTVKAVKISHFYQLIRTWNELPDQLKIKTSIPIFKKRIKQHFLNSY